MKREFFRLVTLAAFLATSACTKGKVEFTDNLAATSMDPSPADSTSYDYRGTSETRLRLGDRYQVASILTDVFGSSAASAINESWVLAYPNYNGAPCDPLENPATPGDPASEGCDSSTDTQSPTIPAASAIRASYLTQACELLTGDDSAVAYAAAQAQSASAWSGAAPTASEVAAAWDLFHPGNTPSSEISTALQGVIDAVGELSDVSETAKPLEQWRFLLLTLCLDPGWGLL